MTTRFRNKLSIENLEGRSTPAIFGTPWADPHHLTVSIAPDGTNVGGESSNLFHILDSAYPREIWQRELLKAFQYWASVTDISIGLVADGGQDFGTSGSLQGDSRFGDIRVGASPMALIASAISVPPDPFLAGTWAGDIVLNSNVNWTDRNNNICGLMLHEVGHALGVPENYDPTSVMYVNTEVAPKTLSERDITAIRNMYGKRTSDSHDAVSSNNTIQTASPLLPLVTNDPTLPFVTFGDITLPGDSDFYSFSIPVTHNGTTTITLTSSGLSLLIPKFTALDDSGNIIDSHVSTGLYDTTLSITIPAQSAGKRLYIEVASGPSDSFKIGRYGLAVSFDGPDAIPLERVQVFLQGPFDTLQSSELAEYLECSNPLLFDDSHNEHSSVSSALELSPTKGRSRTHYSAVGSLSLTSKVDYYRFEAPETRSNKPLVLTIGLTAYWANGIAPNAVVKDSQGKILQSTIISNDAGQYSFQVTGARPGRTYYLMVGGNNSNMVGNYSLAIDSQMPAKALKDLASGQIAGDGSDRLGTLFIAQNQVFHLALTAGTGSVDAGVAMTIIDANGNVAFTLTAMAGTTASRDTAILLPGQYTIRYSAINSSSATDFSLGGLVITDPAGPMVVDPTLDPLYINPQDPTLFLYPIGVVTNTTYLWILWTL